MQYDAEFVKLRDSLENSRHSQETFMKKLVEADAENSVAQADLVKSLAAQEDLKSHIAEVSNLHILFISPFPNTTLSYHRK